MSFARVLHRQKSSLTLPAREHARELTKIERKAGRRARAAECLADAVVAATFADGIRLARGEHRKYRAVVIMIAAKVGEIDVQRVDERRGHLDERFERGER